MARSLNRLSAVKAKTLSEPGRYADGAGLYLSISPGDRKRWVFIYRSNGRSREMGLGSFADVTLAQARQAAERARALLREGDDPLDKRAAEREIPTFRAFADEVLDSLEVGWKNAKHKAQWRSTLDTYCKSIADKRVDRITTDDVLAVLKPIWSTIPETASRLRGRIERILDAATARGLRKGENPARWRGHLANLLPPRKRLTRGHHRALPYGQVPDLVSTLLDGSSTSALCLAFTILTAARSGEALGARWDEIDMEKGEWTIPKERMKAGREHRVPLSPPVIGILETMIKIRKGPFVFPGTKRDRPLSVMALTMVLRRLGVNATVHGFRSSFRVWAAEKADVPGEVAEAALAHTVRDHVEAAYKRTDFFDKRRDLMNLWADFCRR